MQNYDLDFAQNLLQKYLETLNLQTLYMMMMMRGKKNYYPTDQPYIFERSRINPETNPRRRIVN